MRSLAKNLIVKQHHPDNLSPHSPFQTRKLNYLVPISKQSCDLCELCGKRERQTVRHLMLDCHIWGKERKLMWKQIRNDNGWADDRTGIAHLFADRRVTARSLKFLEQTGVGRRTEGSNKGDGREQRHDKLIGLKGNGEG